MTDKRIKVSDETHEKMQEFINKRNELGQVLAQLLIQFEANKAHLIQQIRVITEKERQYIAGMSDLMGIDPKHEYHYDYKTRELVIDK